MVIWVFFTAPTRSPPFAPYRFQRVSTSPTETQMLGGMGTPSPFTGMSRSPFRPSDDATTFPFLIPSQAFAVVELRKLAKLVQTWVNQEESMSNQATDFERLAQLQSSVKSSCSSGIAT